MIITTKNQTLATDVIQHQKLWFSSRKWILQSHKSTRNPGSMHTWSHPWPRPSASKRLTAPLEGGPGPGHQAPRHSRWPRGAQSPASWHSSGASRRGANVLRGFAVLLFCADFVLLWGGRGHSICLLFVCFVVFSSFFWGEGGGVLVFNHGSVQRPFFITMLCMVKNSISHP